MTGSLLITTAAMFAAKYHTGQTRDHLPDPYINHPVRVAARVARAGLSDEAIAAALLHDLLEDTPCERQHLIGAGFPERTVTLVTTLSKWWDNRKAERDLTPAAFAAQCQRVRDEFKPAYYARILTDPEAIAIKLFDRADNMDDGMRTLPGHLAWCKRYLRKTDGEFLRLRWACQHPMALAYFEDSRLAFAEMIAATEELKELGALPLFEQGEANNLQ